MKERGQSLVEMAVIAPLLVFIFIGLIEVGWAILGYMKLLGNSREIARYSTRSDIRDYWLEDDIEAFGLVLGHYELISPIASETSLILHRYEVFTGETCQGGVCWPDCANPDISDDKDSFGVYTYGITRTSNINDNVKLSELMQSHFMLNCQKELRYIKGCLNRADLETCKAEANGKVYTDKDGNTIIAELFYDQPQITGFYAFYNPIPLWAQTTMRIP